VVHLKFKTKSIRVFSACRYCPRAGFQWTPFGISARKSRSPQDWAPDFPTLDIYKDNWLGDAKAAAARADAETLRCAHFAASKLAKITLTLTGTLALCVKRFDGSMTYPRRRNRTSGMGNRLYLPQGQGPLVDRGLCRLPAEIGPRTPAG